MESAPGVFPRRILRLWIPALILALLASSLSIAAFPWALPPAHAAGPCDAPVVSKVACENTQPGSPPSEWQVAGAGNTTIQGYATSMSVNLGETVRFKVKTTASAYRIDVYRLGYYQGLGARKVAANILPSVPLPQAQPNCATFPATGLIDCGNWAVSGSWQVPASAVSGVYLARLVRTDNSAASVIPFVVRDDAAKSDMLFQTSDTTWQAYNTYGGNSLYSCTVACPPGNPLAYKAAFKVSYNRPFNSALDDQGRSWLMYAEYPMIRFMEANGYDVSYMSGLDVATKAPLLLNHKAFLSVGHDEYWSGEQRANVQAARDAGVHLAFFSGNEMFWKTRWEPSSDGSNTAGRTLVSYKDTHFNGPTDPVSWTGTWRDPRYGTSTGGGNPENSLTGQYFMVNSGTTDIVVPSSFKQLRLWRGTSIPSMANGASVTLGAGLGTLGYEWDIDADNGFRPPGAFRLSHTNSTSAEIFTDYGSSVLGGQPATHNLTMYKASSGALVFGSGTVQWSWGLDGYTTGKAVDRNMQQATVNLFADMGSQPTTIVPGLTAAQASTDATAPTSTITSPAAGSTVADGTIVTISGTAADTGGVVAGVEVSTDGGTTWRRANGTTNWTYTWNAHGHPTSVLRSRAVDDSGNLGSGSAGTVVNVSCPCSFVGANVAPSSADAGDAGSIEIGAKFYSDVPGTLTAVRFYKSTRNTGTHVGNVWSESGQRLASATFTGESGSGWQTATLTPPLAISANTKYVVSYFAPTGHYAQDVGYFYNNPSPSGGSNSTDSSPLHFTRSLPGAPNGFYRYGSTSGFPDQIYDAEYYWVDALFTPSGTVAPAVSSVSPSANATNVMADVKPSVTFNQPVTDSSVAFILKNATGATVPGSVAYDAATNTSTFTPSGALTHGTAYTATVSGARNAAGQSMAAPYSWTFTTTAAPAAPKASSVSPVNNATNVGVDIKPTVTFDQAVTGSSVVFGLRNAENTAVAGSTTYDEASHTSTFTPAASLAYGTRYTATVSGATNGSGQTMGAPYSWTFTTFANPDECPCTVFSPTSVPAIPSVNDSNGVELGMKFRSDVAGSVTGVRFYKGTANIGTHTGKLWSRTGTLLASVAFTGESASGWQQANFSSPVNITANTTYVVSYHAPNGNYSANSGYFGTATDRGPLHGLASGVDGPNGVYRYGASAFPAESFNNTNYWVDVVFTTVPATAAPSVVSVTPADNATGVEVGQKPIVTFNQAVTPSSVAFTLKDAAGAGVTGSLAYDASTNSATFTPASALAHNTTYTATVSGATNATGQTMATPHSWTFTTAAATVLPAVTSESPSNNATDASPGTKPTATFNQAVTGSSVVFTLKNAANSAIEGTTTYDPATATATFSPNAELAFSTTYTATVSGATNAAGQSMAAPYTWTFTTVPPGTCPCSIFSSNATPATPNTNDSNPVEVGTKFRSDKAGTVTGVRFYKGSANTGTHTGHLWSSEGSLLASVTFTNETASGWQQAMFSSPVPIAANSTYIVSYFAPDGFYSSSGGFFTSTVDNAPLHALASGVDGPNGVFSYGGTAFPRDSFNNTNYWVDVVFSTSAVGAAPAVVAVSPANNATSVAEGVKPRATFNQQVSASSVQFTLKDASGDPVAGSVAYDSATNTSTLSPGSPLAFNTKYTATVSGATNAAGTSMSAPFSWTFTTKAAPAACPCTVFSPSAAPATANTNDRKAVEVGMKFRSDVAGTVTGVRFFKGISNTGTHVGHLWSSTGTLIASVTFVGETSSGWQQALFSTPVPIAANTTYVVSYYAPVGYYSSTRDYFNSSVDSPPLHGLASGVDGANGVYRYGSTAFPTDSFKNTNYWVDVVFNRS